MKCHDDEWSGTDGFTSEIWRLTLLAGWRAEVTGELAESLKSDDDEKLQEVRTAGGLEC